MTNSIATRDPTPTSPSASPSDRTLTNLEDTSLVAFLKLKGHIAIPWISRTDPNDIRVSFDIQGDGKQIESDMRNFYNNEMVGIQDFCRCLKDVKSSMYNLRRIGKR
jgi:hypothetical protein